MEKIYKFLSSANQVLFALALTVFSGTAYSQTTYTFVYTGTTQTLNLQAGSYSIEIWGGDGGGTTGTNPNAAVAKLGGKGGYARGTLTLSAATTGSIYVGGKGATEGVGVPGGFNGGGNSGGGSGPSGVCGSGGGASDVRIGGNAFTDRQIVAGGGGAAGYQECNGTAGAISGGHGGGLIGGDPVVGSYAARIGHGGTQSAGGAGGSDATYVTGNAGTFGLGANGGIVNVGSGNGAGGGGGWYGGGSGSNGFYCAGGGGGGSSYIGGVTSGTTIMFGQPGFVANPDVSGNGYVLVTELCSIIMFVSGSSNTLNPAICSGQSLTLTTNAVSNYSWSTGQTTNSIVVAPNTNTVYSLVATSSLNCSASATRSVNVNSAAPVLSISNPSSNICLGRTVSLTASGALTYTWTNPGVVNGQTFTPSSTAAYTVTGQNGCGTTVSTTTITITPLAVTASASSTLVCQGYPSTLTAASSVNGYTWMPGTMPGSMVTVAPMANTLYTVTATDGICSGTQTVLVTTKTTPTITTSQTLVTICDGESILLTGSGAGTGGTYSWTPGGPGQSITLTPPTSTNVVVVGTNSLGCAASNQQIIIVAAGPPVTVTASSPVVCTGSQVVLTASGAPAYQWTGGPGAATYSVNPTSAVNVYTVTGSQTSNTCTTVKTITVAAVIPNVSFSSSLSTCDGNAVTFTASGATSYTWNTFVSPLGSYQTTPTASGVYTLYATTSVPGVNCKTTNFATVTVNALPNLTVTPGKETICKGETHTLTVTGASTYSWGAAGSGSVITVKPTLNTPYTVTGIDANGCENTLSYTAKVNACNGIEEISGAQTISVYPNPNNGQFFVKSESAITLNIINTLGQHIKTVELNSENGFSVEVSGLAKGIYYLSSGSDVNTKLIVN